MELKMLSLMEVSDKISASVAVAPREIESSSHQIEDWMYYWIGIDDLGFGKEKALLLLTVSLFIG